MSNNGFLASKQIPVQNSDDISEKPVDSIIRHLKGVMDFARKQELFNKLNMS